MTDCCLCVFTRPQPYMRLITSLYPKGSRGNDIHEEILQTVDIGKLSKYVLDKPKYLVYIGEELSNRIRNYLRKGKLGYVMVSIKAVAAIWEGISGSSGGSGGSTTTGVKTNDIGTRTIFEDHVISLLLMLLIHPHIELRTIAAELCSNFINGQDYLIDQPRLEGFMHPLLHILRYQNDKPLTPPVWYSTLWNNHHHQGSSTLGKPGPVVSPSTSSSFTTPLPWIPPSFTTDKDTVKARISALQAIGNLLKKSDASSLDNRIVIILPLILHTIHRELMISYWTYLSNHSKEYHYQFFQEILSSSSSAATLVSSSPIHDKIMLYLLDHNLLPLSNVLNAADHVLTVLARVLNPATASAILEPLFHFFDTRSWQPLSMILHVMRILDPCNGFIKHLSNAAANNLSDNFTLPEGLYDTTNNPTNEGDAGYSTGLGRNSTYNNPHNNLKFSTSMSSPPLSPVLSRYNTDTNNFMGGSNRYLPGHVLNPTGIYHLSSMRTTTSVGSQLRHRIGPALTRAAFSTPGIILLLRHLTSVYALFETNVTLPAAMVINAQSTANTIPSLSSSTSTKVTTNITNGTNVFSSLSTDSDTLEPLPVPGSEKLSSYPASLWWLAAVSHKQDSSTLSSSATVSPLSSTDAYGNARLQTAEKSFDNLRIGILSIANFLLTETGTDVPFGPWISEILDYILPTIVDPTYNNNNNSTDNTMVNKDTIVESHFIHYLANEIIGNLCIRLESGPDILRLGIGLAEGYGEHVAEYGSLINHPIFHNFIPSSANDSGTITGTANTPVTSHRLSTNLTTGKDTVSPLSSSSFSSSARVPIHSLRTKSTSLIRQVSNDINGLRRQPSNMVNTIPVIDETDTTNTVKTNELPSSTISNEEITKAANAAANMVLHTHTYSNRVRSVLRRPSALAALGPLLDTLDNPNNETNPGSSASSTVGTATVANQSTVLVNAIHTAKLHAYAARQRLLQCLHMCIHRYRVLSSQAVNDSMKRTHNMNMNTGKSVVPSLPTVTVQISSEIFAALEIAMAEDDNQLRKMALVIMHHLLCSDIPVGLPDIDGTMDWCTWSETTNSTSNENGTLNRTITVEATTVASPATSPWSFTSIPWNTALSLTERHISRLFTALFYILRNNNSKDDIGNTEYALIARLLRDTVRIEGIEIVWRILPFLWTVWDTLNEPSSSSSSLSGSKESSLLTFTHAVFEILSIYLASEDIGGYLTRPIDKNEDDSSSVYTVTNDSSFFTSPLPWITETKSTNGKKLHKERIVSPTYRQSFILFVLASPVTRAYLRDIQIPVPEELSIVDLYKTLLPSLSNLPLDPSTKLSFPSLSYHHRTNTGTRNGSTSNHKNKEETKELVSWLYPSGNQENNWNIHSGVYLRHVLIEMDSILRTLQQPSQPTVSLPTPPSPTLPTVPSTVGTDASTTEPCTDENTTTMNDTLPSNESLSAVPPQPIAATLLPSIPAPDLRKALDRFTRRRHNHQNNNQHNNYNNAGASSYSHSFTASFYSDGMSDGSTASDTGKGSTGSGKDSSSVRSSYISQVHQRIMECLGQLLLLPLNKQNLLICDGLIEITRDGEQRIHLHVLSSSSLNNNAYYATLKEKDTASSLSSSGGSGGGTVTLDKSPVRRYQDNNGTVENDNDVMNDNSNSIANDDLVENKGTNSNSVLQWKPTKASLLTNARAAHGPTINDLLTLLGQPNTTKVNRSSALDYERQKKMLTNANTNGTSSILVTGATVTTESGVPHGTPAWLQFSREPAVTLRYS